LTYCLGILLHEGLVLASDSRSNAGIDQVAKVNKLEVISQPGERVIVILSAGNLATTQAVVTSLREASSGQGLGLPEDDLRTAHTLFDAATTVGAALRRVVERDGQFVKAFADPSASFIVGGQIKGEAPRLFEIYSAGNFIEASARSSFIQIGETKYGKPILDRALGPDTDLAEAAKLALLSFDATIRSNLSVGPPIDMVRYRADSFEATVTTFEEQDPYFRLMRQAYAEGLSALVNSLPAPP